MIPVFVELQLEPCSKYPPGTILSALPGIEGRRDRMEEGCALHRMERWYFLVQEFVRRGSLWQQR